MDHRRFLIGTAFVRNAFADALDQCGWHVQFGHHVRTLVSDVDFGPQDVWKSWLRHNLNTCLEDTGRLQPSS